ncbi:hypothetical protein QOZ88_01900 [Blastococcus sp. BMG 814]|uniref:Uncharacterized protein n=1 Tax=Blastococcus carthaginiensis TaxID=3050034 RepID=A0ABT9I739_9ACTN|nr:hypothetical protein [Blastococcus carthaginiensis]MDP5181380.1 hypothetical protein [Blastococcus carthaginiensis]
MPVRPRARRASLPPVGAARGAGDVVGPAAGPAAVRCLDVRTAGDGEPAVDPRPIAVTGERAARDDRAPDSWEPVMPWGEPTEEQRRLPAAGHAVRGQLPVAVVRP